jgi:tetratricopeptide (TPR) repeat protein
VHLCRPLKSIVKAFFVLLVAIQLNAQDVWSAPDFAVDAASLRHASELVKAAKHSEATVLLNDVHFNFDVTGNLKETHHLIYRVEDSTGVENWAETSGRWEAWHQEKPAIKARVITSDGVEHWLDTKTLTDVPVHENAPDLYSDERRYGGPLPAVAEGAIIEEEVVIRDTAPLFAAGMVRRWVLGWGVPVNKTRVVITHPEALSLHYQVHLLPDATVTKAKDGGSETITLEQGPIAAFREEFDHVPGNVVLRPEIEFATGTSWQLVASEYARLSNDRLRVSDVRPLVAKVKTEDRSRDDIIRGLVSVLHKNIRYTGVEFGESNLIPQFPSETLSRKYGDCKDKAAVLVAMLRSAGVAANIALLDSGPGRDINAELPGMGMFDHAIVYVPASGSDSELWIDATAQYSQVGTLPWMDYGRKALVISEKTETLNQIPEVTASQNVHRELREFTLAEYGMATISETDEETGPEEADYRSYYSGDRKEARESTEKYVKEAYLADSLTSLEHDDLDDLEKPGSVKLTTKGKRGTTDLTSAIMAIRVEGLFDRLPGYFKTKEEESTVEEGESEKPTPRTADWRITPFTTEWRYKVTAPLGFKLRALPSEKTEKIDTLMFTQKYSANPEGTVVEAVLRVENPNTRMTAQQAKDLRDAVLKARKADPIFITFDHVGYSLVSAGKIKEGLEAYRQLAAQHPKEALHKVQLAQGLLTAGLGEEARKVAAEATALEPSSALAFSTLGMVLKRDLIGRLEKKGMDYEGAIAAYKKAIALDAKDKEIRANLALLMEYDAEGTRYGEKARLKEAAEQLKELKKLDAEYSRNYEDNILYDLWYAHDYQGVLDYGTTLPATNERKGLMLAAIAVLQGTDAALKKSLEITTDDEARGKALITAGSVLVRVRKYAEGASLLREGARGQSNESQVMRGAAIFSKTKPYEGIKIDPAEPCSAVQKLFVKMLNGTLTIDEFKSLAYQDAAQTEEPLNKEEFQRMLSNLRVQLGGTGLPLITIADLALSNMHFTTEGDDALGYKITLEAPGAPTQHFFVVRDGGEYKITGYAMSDTVVTEELAPVALREIEKRNLIAARAWLDRARERMPISTGDDPLSGNPFPHFWTKGQEADVSAMRTAALVLLASKQTKGAYLTELEQARQTAKTDLEHGRVTMVLAYAYGAQEEWNKMLPLTQELMKAFPTSVRAFEMTVGAYIQLKQFDEWENLVQARVREQPDEVAYVRSSAQLASYRGQYGKAREILRTLIDRGRAGAGDMNQYAWYALMVDGGVDQEAIDTVLQANDLTKNSNFAILHTLACDYAQAGKGTQAREMLLKAMEASHLEEPNSEIWFGFALIAEQYGALDAAEKMYRRVEKPKVDYPSSSYSIAQLHLAGLLRSTKSAEKSAAK